MVKAESNNKSVRNWIIDSGASSHMCGDEQFFNELVPVSGKSVSLTDGHKATTKAIGSGSLVCTDKNGVDHRITLSGVLHVPELETNLISVSKLTEKGAEVTFAGSKCYVSKQGRKAAVAVKREGLYHLQHLEREVVAAVHFDGCPHDWHRKLGHRDPEAIRRMVRDKLATGINVKQYAATNDNCDCCLEGKMARLPFPKKSSRSSKKVLDLIHTDICGPMNTVSPGGCRYFMTMIDDFSRFTVVYFLQRKSEAAERIQQYVRMVETRFGRKPVVIRSDQGGEYKSTHLRQFYRSEGITPQ